MVEGAGSIEASIVFEKLFNDYLVRQTDGGKLTLYMRKLDALRKTHPILEGLYVSDTGEVTLDLRKWDTVNIVRDMSRIYDSLIEIAAFTEGPEKAFSEARNSVEDVRKQLESSFSRLNIRDHILKGSLRKFAPTGVEGMDRLVGGGIPVNNMVLLVGPPGNEKYQLAFQFLAQGLNEGGAGLVTVSSMSVKEVKSRLAKLKVKVPSCETKGLLKIVDWFSQKSKAIIGMEEHGGVFVPSKDLSNLDIALMASIEKQDFAPTRRGIIDVITSALGMYSTSEVTEFLQRQKSRLKRKGITSMFIVEEGAHDERVMSTLKHLADGVIVLTKDKKGSLAVQVESMDGTRFDPRICGAKSSRKGLAVVEGRVDEIGIINDFTNIPGVDRDKALCLIDAGFADLDKLNMASRTELTEVESITDDVAGKILEYMGSVEYSQRVLAKKSEKWRERGMAQAAASDVQRAKMSFNRALEIFQGNVQAWLELSRLHYGEGKEEESRNCFEKAESFDPSVVAPWLGIDAKGEKIPCSHCGSEIDGEVHSCPTCGVPLTLEERIKLRGDGDQ